MKNKILSFLATAALGTTLFFASCKEDKCKDVTCNNGGTCIDGTCECATGYEGTTCDTEARTKFTGTTSTSYRFDDTYNGETAAGDYNAIFTKLAGTDVKLMTITNVGAYGTTMIVPVKVSGSSFTQTASFTTGGVTVTELTGTKRADGKIQFSYKASDATSTYTNTATQI